MFGKLSSNNFFQINIGNDVATFAITNTKRYVSVATLLIQDNGKLLQYLKSGFKKLTGVN